MGRGRPRKIDSDNSTLKLSKSDLAKREAEREALEKFDELRKSPPHWLDHMAKLEYIRVADLMRDKLPVSELDLTLIASYANLYSIYRKLTRDINKYGTVLIEQDEDGNEISRRVNPSWNAFLNTQKELRALASALGMTPSSRMSLVEVDKEDEGDKFLELIKGVK